MTRSRQAEDDSPLTAEDTIEILIATDSHVGYIERDPVRGDDSWKGFDEVMQIARQRDVDMVLLAGDLFHETKPSRKSMYNVMRSLRMNCLGDKPCSLQLLSDASENFGGSTFDHVNYEDENINVAIPVFSIHGNHDDPTEEGRYAALDLLQMSGFVNYFGRTPETDNIVIKPVLLQKGRTKLALYGMSNVRDERLFRTFRDGKVKFYQPGTQKSDWFNLMAVHQNHYAHSQTGYLPENFLPEFLDLVIWGHEHECLIEPRYNPEMGFHVIQPGSSVATSLCPGEAVTKKVAILKITGRDFKVEPIRLKSIRPFVMREVILADERALKGLWKKDNNRTEITRHLQTLVDEMIEEANQQFMEAQDDDDEEVELPKPLIRLRVEYTAPEGGRFDCENPQRFSNRFSDKVANTSDVVQFYRKKVAAGRKSKNEPEMPEQSVIADIALDSVKVDKLVRGFLEAQSLTILPQNNFGDSVSQYVDKDDKHAMEVFVAESLDDQFKHLMMQGGDDEVGIEEEMDKHRSKQEDMFAKGNLRRKKSVKLKPKPPNWDSDMEGHWEDEPAARVIEDDGGEQDEAESVASASRSTRGRGARGRGGRVAAAATTRKTTASRQSVATTGKGRTKRPFEEEDDDEESDVQMILDDDDEDEEEMFVSPAKKAPAKKAATTSRTTARAAPVRTTPARRGAASARQSTLSFSQQPVTQQGRGRSNGAKPKAIEISDDEISDDDAFEPAPTQPRSRR